MFRVYKNQRAVSVGSKVLWFKLPNMDVCLSVWERRLNVLMSHGKFTPQPVPDTPEPYEIIVARQALHDTPRTEIDLYNQCPRCESGRRIMPGQRGDLMHAILLCLDCGLIFNLRHLMYRN